MKFQGSMQFQTELALCNQMGVTASYQRLRTMARRQIDQMMRTRNSKPWNKRMEKGVLAKSQKGGIRHRGKKSGRMLYSGSQLRQRSKEDSCSLNHRSHSGQWARSF